MVDGNEQVRLPGLGQRDVATDALLASKGSSAAAADDDERLGLGQAIACPHDREVSPALDDLDARLGEAVAPALEPRSDEGRPRRPRQEEPDVRATEAQRRISS